MKSVLVIDDEEQIRRHLKTALADDYNFDTAATIEEAEKKIAKNTWDFVFVDLRMTDLTDFGGIQLFQTIKCQKTKAIVLSAYPFDGHVKEEFKKVLKDEPNQAQILKDIEKNYISKIGDENYIYAVLQKIQTS